MSDDDDGFSPTDLARLKGQAAFHLGPSEVELSTLSRGYCEELAAYVLSPPGTEWAKYQTFTHEMESLALRIQDTITHWLREKRLQH